MGCCSGSPAAKGPTSPKPANDSQITAALSPDDVATQLEVAKLEVVKMYLQERSRSESRRGQPDGGIYAENVKKLDEDEATKAALVEDYMNQSQLERTRGQQLLTLFKVTPWGVLGDERLVGGDSPDPHHVITDPAGLHHIQDGPAFAGGAAGAIYSKFGIDRCREFPADVRDCIKCSLEAKFHQYNNCAIIHAVGPMLGVEPYVGRGDKRDKRNLAIEALSAVYYNIFSEFLLQISHLKRFRLLPMSAGIFAGDYKPEIPDLTALSMSRALGRLTDEQVKQLQAEDVKAELCIFDAKEFPLYVEALRKLNPSVSTVERINKQNGAPSPPISTIDTNERKLNEPEKKEPTRPQQFSPPTATISTNEKKADEFPPPPTSTIKEDVKMPYPPTSTIAGSIASMETKAPPPINTYVEPEKKRDKSSLCC